MIQGIIFMCALVLTLAFYIIFRNERKKYLPASLKIMALVYFILVFFRYILSDAFIYVIKDGMFEGRHYNETDILQSILRWGQYCSYIVIPMAVFFDSRLFKNIAVYFCMPFAIASTFYFNDFMSYFMDASGKGFKPSELFRTTYFAAELVLAIAMPLIITFSTKHYFKVNDKREWFNLLSLPFIAFTLIPVYIPQSLIGYTDFFMNALSFINIAWIAFIILEIVVLYMLFRFKDFRQRYMLCVFLALGLFFHYNSLMLMGFNIRRLPIQLCNLGAYFFIIALIIKKRAFFNFAFLANVMGTIIAIVAPDSFSELGSFWTVHYMYEHMQVLIVPALCMLLRIFPRLKNAAVKHLIIGFSCYFLFCWVSGTLINTYLAPKLGNVNFFYIFEINKAVEKLSFLNFTRAIKVTFNGYIFYPVYQIMIYGAFLSLCIALYFAVLKLYDIIDDRFELRKARIDLYEKLSGKTSASQREYKDSLYLCDLKLMDKIPSDC